MGKERHNDQPFIINLPPVRFALSSRREHREKQEAFDWPCELCVSVVNDSFVWTFLGSFLCLSALTRDYFDFLR